MRTIDGSSPTLVLQTGDTDIAQNDILEQLTFKNFERGTGSDAILVASVLMQYLKVTLVHQVTQHH